MPDGGTPDRGRLRDPPPRPAVTGRCSRAKSAASLEQRTRQAIREVTSASGPAALGSGTSWLAELYSVQRERDQQDGAANDITGGRDAEVSPVI
jgi:hypothetical protein